MTDAAVTQLLRSVAGADAIACRTRALIAVLHACPVDTWSLARANRSAADIDAGVLRLVPLWRVSNVRRGHATTAVETFPLCGAALVYLAAYLDTRLHARPGDPLFVS